MENIVAVPNQASESGIPESQAIIVNGPFDLEQKEAPLSIYAQENKMPYTAKYFGLANYIDLKESNPTADLTNLLPKIGAIEDYVISKVINDQYLDSTKSYRDIVQDIKDLLGIKEQETPESQIEKVFSFVKINSKLTDISKPEIPRNSKADQLQQNKVNKTNEVKPAHFNKRIDNLIGKRLDQYFGRLDNQMKRVDQAMYKRVDDQLKKFDKIQKASKLIDKYLR